MDTKSKQMIEEGSELRLQFEKRDGLLPVVVQESSSGDILMIASVNGEALNQTIKSGKATFWSTSRQKIWVKGETSENALLIEEILVDCDQDALIYKVTLDGKGACHTTNKKGSPRKSCFYRKLNTDSLKLEFLEK
ncbi:phosphoribosyl-AMP cyclohydrolase [Rhodohalobacter sulfatireducens]|uniref:phosphoribosyl-AMP cyclohydrolase n=1 Tax=Rhodohalobacter sulfatireducens TaxID=2911366 RepID=A0ABS9KFL4_9BACT|nr:phosphoribosyl-AMP cyclohydrolase [Rhodohalobacter sulfatireducens]MCG2589644.1 phosphoribosyl-AMP cyclohydrolase [Rhodohalobacter sulfatireducens]